jgi:type III secretion protein W
MSDPKINPIDGIKKPSLGAENLKMQAKEAQAANALVIQEQVASEESLMSFAELGSEFNPVAMGRNFKELQNQPKKETELASVSQEELEADSESSQKIAEQFNKKNPELNVKSLLLLKTTVSQNDTTEQILAKVKSTYPDPSLADEALDFLIDASKSNGALKSKLTTTKEEFNQTSGREIRAGKNIQQAAREFAKEGLGNPNALRDLYRDITGNPREAPALFEELSTSFPFPKMKMVIDFILHSLGQDMKSKGPSISKEELLRLFSETRTMQAILGVYRFFFLRTKLMQGEFKRADLAMPNTVNFQTLSKAFMNIIKDRYPNPQKILSFAKALGISEEMLAKIIVYTQMRDALREVSPKLFKSEQHRQEMLMSFIETLSELEDEMEEEEEEEEEEKK